MAAIKANQISAGDVLVLIGRGPMGAGMEETYQITSALKHLPFGKHVPSSPTPDSAACRLARVWVISRPKRWRGGRSANCAMAT